MYHEDTDLSWRTNLLGWKVLYVPERGRDPTRAAGSSYRRFLIADHGPPATRSRTTICR